MNYTKKLKLVFTTNFILIQPNGFNCHFSGYDLPKNDDHVIIKLGEQNILWSRFFSFGEFNRRKKWIAV